MGSRPSWRSSFNRNACFTTLLFAALLFAARRLFGLRTWRRLLALRLFGLCTKTNGHKKNTFFRWASVLLQASVLAPAVATSSPAVPSSSTVSMAMVQRHARASCRSSLFLSCAKKQIKYVE